MAQQATSPAQSSSDAASRSNGHGAAETPGELEGDDRMPRAELLSEPRGERPGQRTGVFVPRKYQQELLEMARESNVIIRMDTGTGKTLIALLLVEHIRSVTVPKDGEAPKLIVFFAPTASLVQQHADMFKTHSDAKTAVFVGSMAPDLWAKADWDAKLAGVELIVCTPQIWLNALNQGFVKMANVSLLVFDEAHHCRKAHPYAIIMMKHLENYDDLAPSDRPRILGLTANPVHSTKQPRKDVIDLEDNLHAKLVEVEVNKADLDVFLHKPVEKIVEYEPSHVLDEPGLPEWTESVRLAFGDEVFKEKDWIKLLLALSELGPLGCDLCAYILLENMVEKQSMPGMRESGVDEYYRLTRMADDLLRKFDDYMATIDIKTQPLLVSDKLRTLFKILEEHQREPEFQCIVFVERRLFDKAVAIMFSMHGTVEAGMKSWAKATYLVGHGLSENSHKVTKDVSMTTVQQIGRVRAFARQDHNVLIATNIAEEGLDFSACSCVIRFDGVRSMVGYVQSRGRARKKGSSYYVMTERVDPSAVGPAESADAKRYKGFVTAEPEIRQKVFKEDGEEMSDEICELESHRLENTGALLHQFNAIGLLYWFCATISEDYDPYHPQLKPVLTYTPFVEDGERVFTCRLEIPMTAGLDIEQCAQISEPRPNQRLAKQEACYRACKALLDAGLLDDNLVPLRLQLDEADHQEFMRAVKSAPVPPHIVATTEDRIGDVTSEEKGFKEALWLACMEFEPLEGQGGKARFGLLSEKQLIIEPFTIYDREARAVRITCTSSKRNFFGSVAARGERLNQLNHFNRLVQAAGIPGFVRNDDHLPAYVALLQEGKDEIDWEAIEGAFPQLQADAGIQPGHLLISRLKHARYRFVRVLPAGSLAPMDTFLDHIPSITGKQRQDYITFNQHWGQVIKNRYHYTNSMYVDEPVLEVAAWPANSGGGLAPVVLPAQDSQALAEKAYYLPLGLLKTSALPLPWWDLVPSLPAIVLAIESQHRARQFVENFQLTGVEDLHPFMESFMMNVGAGLDYQTLETVGDAVLQLLVSIALYFDHPRADEGVLTEMRTRRVDNRHLMKVAREAEFGRYVIWMQLRRRAWRKWTCYATEVDKSAGEWEKNIHPKALADCVESVLAAAYISGGLPLVLQLGTKLKLLFGGTEEWRNRPSAAHYRGEPSMPMEAFEGLEQAIGYHFFNSRLLLQAFVHRTDFSRGIFCYERQEFLGDALLEYWVTDYIYKNVPNVNEASITFLRAQMISNANSVWCMLQLYPDYASLIRHKIPGMMEQMFEGKAKGLEFGPEFFFTGLTWAYDPPKIMGDVVEALMAAVFVDSNYDLDVVFRVFETIYAPVLPLLTQVDVARDPLSSLNMLTDGMGCYLVEFEHQRSADGKLHIFSAVYHEHYFEPIADPSQRVAHQRCALGVLKHIKDLPPIATPCRKCDKAAKEAAERERRLAEQRELEKKLAEEQREAMLKRENELGPFPSGRAAGRRRSGDGDEDDEEEDDDDDVFLESERKRPRLDLQSHGGAADQLQAEFTHDLPSDPNSRATVFGQGRSQEEEAAAGGKKRRLASTPTSAVVEEDRMKLESPENDPDPRNWPEW